MVEVANARKPPNTQYKPGPHGEICTLIEGVGPTFGLYWQPCNVVPDPQIKLLCFSQDGDYIQFDTTVDCGSLILAGEVIQEGGFTINPNPFTDEIEVRFSEGLHHAARISVVNMMG